MIICNLTIKEELKNIPKLYLPYRELNSIFSLDYKDLFIEINNKIYFLVIHPQRINLSEFRTNFCLKIFIYV